MNLEQLLAELRLDADFASLPEAVQLQLAQQVASGGISAAASFGAPSTPAITPANLAEYVQYFPEISEQIASRAASGDRRSLAEWASAHSQVDPTWLASLQRRLNESMPSEYPPEVRAALERWRTKAQQNVDLDTDPVPVEQDLIERTLERGYADLERDDARRAWAQGLVAEYDPLFQRANQTLADLYDGNMLRSEQAESDLMTATQQGALADQMSTRGAALDAQMATRRGALDEAMRKFYEAQDPLSQARLDAANAEAAGINLAVQGERDRVLADFAQDGYVGGSTGTDAALARASLAGRQAAAQTMGAARVANATDMAGIGRYGASEGRSLADFGAGESRTLTDYGAAEKRGIVDEGAGRRLGFFTQDIQRRLDNLTKPQGLFTSRIQMADAADDFGNSGFRRLMGNLSGFSTNGTPPPSFAPYQQPVNDVMGSGMQNLGAGLFGMGGSFANAYFSRQGAANNPNSISGFTTNTGVAPSVSFAPNRGPISSFGSWGTPKPTG